MRSVLLDETKQGSHIEICASRGGFLNSISNTKRSLMSKIADALTFEVFKSNQLEVAEGTSVTVMGLLTFDLSSGQWQMAELLDVFVGGAKDCYSLLAAHIADLEMQAFVCNFASAVLLTATLIKLTTWYYDRQEVLE